MNMQRAQSRRDGRKSRVNLTISADLVERARALGLNLSEVAEQGLRAATAEADRQRWIEENAEALAEHQARVERHGSFAEEFGALLNRKRV